MGESATVGGRYALDGRLGEGGMGQVYKARHLQLGKAFALKIIDEREKRRMLLHNDKIVLAHFATS